MDFAYPQYGRVLGHHSFGGIEREIKTKTQKEEREG